MTAAIFTDDAALIQGIRKTDLVATAINAHSFKTLATALHSAGLIKTLQGEGLLSAFGPSDAAFAKLPAGVSPFGWPIIFGDPSFVSESEMRRRNSSACV